MWGGPTNYFVTPNLSCVEIEVALGCDKMSLAENLDFFGLRFTFQSGQGNVLYKWDFKCIFNTKAL